MSWLVLDDIWQEEMVVLNLYYVQHCAGCWGYMKMNEATKIETQNLEISGMKTHEMVR